MVIVTISIGSLSSHVKTFIKGLRKISKANHVHVHFAPKHIVSVYSRYPYIALKNIHNVLGKERMRGFLEKPSRYLFDNMVSFLLDEILNYDNVSLVHAFWLYTAYAAAYITKRKFIPSIVTVLGGDIQRINIYENKTRDIYPRSNLLFVLRNTSTLVVPEDSFLKILRSIKIKYSFNYELEKIPMWYDSFLFKKDKIPQYPVHMLNKVFNLKIPDNSIIICFGPRPLMFYGFHDAIYVFNKLAKQYDNVYLLVIGSKTLITEHLLSLANPLVRRKIILLGSIPRNLMPIIYSSCYVFLNLCYMGQGVSSLEAMALGVPVIGYKSFQHKILDERTGYLCRLGDRYCIYERLKMLMTDGNLHYMLSRGATDYAIKNHSLEVIVPLYIKLYMKVVK